MSRAAIAQPKKYSTGHLLLVLLLFVVTISATRALGFIDSPIREFVFQHRADLFLEGCSESPQNRFRRSCEHQAQEYIDHLSLVFAATLAMLIAALYIRGKKLIAPGTGWRRWFPPTFCFTIFVSSWPQGWVSLIWLAFFAVSLGPLLTGLLRQTPKRPYHAAFCGFLYGFLLAPTASQFLAHKLAASYCNQPETSLNFCANQRAAFFVFVWLLFLLGGIVGGIVGRRRASAFLSR